MGIVASQLRISFLRPNTNQRRATTIQSTFNRLSTALIDLNMALRASFRTIAPLARPAAVRSFHATPRAFVKVGDEIPDLEVLHESTPGTKINLAEEFKDGDGYIVGVPAAFSGTCSSSHVPSYINHPKLKEAGKVFVVSVNDVFV